VAAGAGPARTALALLRIPVASVRWRATLVGVAVVAIALTVGAVGLVSLLRSSMREGVETTAGAQLNDVASLLRVGPLPAQLPAGRGDTYTQVVAADGSVLASSADLGRRGPISTIKGGEDGLVIHTLPALSGGESAGAVDADGPFLVLAQQYSGVPASAGGPVTVYVAASLHPVIAATHTVEIGLLGGLPVLVVLVGALIWVFGGVALRPVEAIRAEVADISGRDLHRRVPVPPTKDEVAQLAQTMNAMLDRLETAAAAQNRFVADASHELRSPLAALRASLEVAAAHPDQASWSAVAGDALDETRRLQRLIDDLLALASSHPGRARTRREEVDLDEIVMSEARRLRAAGCVDIDLRRVSGGRVEGDSDQLARVVQNLMDNAQRHAESRVSVELTSDPESVLLVVENDGPPIPADERERIFEPFARLDESRSQDSGGAGLGLAIVKEIVSQHGGRVSVADTRSGARFEVRLAALGGSVPERRLSGAHQGDDRTG
jgi:signal transduction histidine kinase